MNAYKEKFTLMSHDTDTNDNARPSIITRLMQETADHHMRDRHPSYIELFSQGKSFVLTRFTCEIKEQLHQYDEVEGYTWACDGKAATFIRCYLIKKEGRIAAKAYSEWAVADRINKKICLLDELDLSAYEKDEPLEFELPLNFRIPKGTELIPAGNHNVVYSEVDVNMHMNNTYYPDMLRDIVKDSANKKVTSFSIRFREEAPLNGNIEISVSESLKAKNDGCGGEEMYYFKTSVNGKTNTEAVMSFSKL